jgi:hypothetical protein
MTDPLSLRAPDQISRTFRGRWNPAKLVCATFLCGAAFASVCSGAATVTQTFPLQPGWNSIFLEVEPVSSTPAVVFAGIPVEMVWSYFPTTTPLEYIQNPADGLWNVAGWNVYLPSHVPDAAALTNLFAIQAHRAYLIKLNGSTPVTLTVSGTPTYKEIAWRPDSFTITGLPVSPAVTVRSGDYFFNSTAHKSQPRFRLDPNGTWIALNDNSILNAGVAYWIFSKGGSNFSAPLVLEFGGGDRLDFGPALESRKLVIRNRGATALDAVVENPTGFPLVYSTISPTGATEWNSLTSLTKTVAAGASVSITVGVKRLGLPATSEGLLNVWGVGIVRRLVVAAENPVAASASSNGSTLKTATTSGANPNTGLWIGTVTLSAVSEPHSANPVATTATPAEFNLRLLLHVDGNGTARLLKEVFLMKQANSAALVLLSDPALLPMFQTPGNRDGARFAPRVSCIGYEFPGTELVLSGGFETNLSGTLVTGRNSPTNPFKHRYHPDHDDLTASYQTPPANLPSQQQEVWEVSRAVSLTFAPAGADQAPSTGFSVRKGTYREEVTGLTKDTLITTGNFTLQRFNTVREINPAPAQ